MSGSSQFPQHLPTREKPSQPNPGQDKQDGNIIKQQPSRLIREERQRAPSPPQNTRRTSLELEKCPARGYSCASASRTRDMHPFDRYQRTDPYRPSDTRGGYADTYRPLDTYQGAREGARAGPDAHRAPDTHQPQVAPPRRPNPTASVFTPLNTLSSHGNSAGKNFTPYQPIRFASSVLYPSGVQQYNHAPPQSPEQSQPPTRRSDRLKQQQPGFYAKLLPGEPLPTGRDGPRFENGDRTRRSVTPSRKERYHTSTKAPALPIPRPTLVYLEQANRPHTVLSSPQPLLVILDLNGTLILRKNKAHPTSFHARPGVETFLNYIFFNHTVMIYSSARPENVRKILEKLLSKEHQSQLAAIWGRDKLGLKANQYNEKVQVYKRLEQVWNDNQIQLSHPGGGQERWAQHNTVLIDDSHLKAAAQPHNLIQVPEFTKVPQDQIGKDKESKVLENLRIDLEVLKYQDDISSLIRKWQTKTVGEMTPEPALGLKSQAETNTNANDDSIDLTSEASDASDGQGVKLVRDGASEAPSAGQARGVSPISDTVWKELLGQPVEREEPTDGTNAMNATNIEVDRAGTVKIPGLFLTSNPAGRNDGYGRSNGYA